MRDVDGIWRHIVLYKKTPPFLKKTCLSGLLENVRRVDSGQNKPWLPLLKKVAYICKRGKRSAILETMMENPHPSVCK